MKIEKISMEFVTFDAQDVIATSGGADYLWIKTDMVEPGDIGSEWNLYGASATIGGKEGKVAVDKKMASNSYFKIGDDSKYLGVINGDTYEFHLDILETTKTAPSSYTTDWTEIYNWISTNCN